MEFQRGQQHNIRELVADCFVRCLSMIQTTTMSEAPEVISSNSVLKLLQIGSSQSECGIVLDVLFGPVGSEWLVERWRLNYLNVTSSSSINIPATSQRCSTLLRSLYCLLRLLPSRKFAHKVSPESAVRKSTRIYSRTSSSSHQQNEDMRSSITFPVFVGSTSSFDFPDVFLATAASTATRKSGPILQVKLEHSVSTTLRFMLDIPLLKSLPAHVTPALENSNLPLPPPLGSSASASAGAGAGAKARRKDSINGEIGMVPVPSSLPSRPFMPRSLPIPIVIEQEQSNVSASSSTSPSLGLSPSFGLSVSPASFGASPSIGGSGAIALAGSRGRSYSVSTSSPPQHSPFIPAPPTLQRGSALGGFQGLAVRLESYNLTPWPPLPAKHDAMQNAAHVKEGGEDLEKDLIRELKPRFDSDPGTTTVQERLIELRKFLSEQRLLS